MPNTSHNWLFSLLFLAIILLMAAWLGRSDFGEQSASVCELDKQDCAISLDEEDGKISIMPKPIPLEEELDISILLPAGVTFQAAHIEGVNMFMGRIPVIVEHIEGRHHQAVSFLGSCTEPQMHWRLVLNLKRDDGQALHRQWDFYTHSR
ncbi:hypothetical protein GCM10009092_07760 [Bowmanella denitrificans]|uniref:Uncharacterized protein n=1 Tax=Bowmanella denitrificans TaxID=366582 RepID=A0ABN0WSX4_9ALTE